MTEAEWLACTDPQKMLEFLRGKASDRKLRLFACACCHHIWHLFTDERSRKAVAVAEQFADGLTSQAELQEALESAEVASRHYHAQVESDPISTIAWAAGGYAEDTTQNSAYDCAEAIITDYWFPPPFLSAWKAAWPRINEDRLSCLRDIFGNPFHPVAVEPEWLAWSGGTVIKLAQGIYEDRAFDRLPVLADALEDAGCHDADVQAHCRQPGEHVRGCWVVDLLLDKE
jgi:hypothetical protein